MKSVTSLDAARTSLPRIAFFSIAFALGTAGTASAQETVTIGLPLFLSGPGAASAGEPSRNAAELVIEAMNGGALPAPYDKAGLSGLKVEAKFVDESGNLASVVTEYKNMIQRDGVDLVLGYFSSANCHAVAPIADELKTLTVLYGCGTSTLFDGNKYTYSFMAAPHTTSDNVAAARYIAKRFPDMKTYSGINNNYSWGHENWRDFDLSVKALLPQATVGKELYTKLFAGDYGAEISSLLSSGSSVIQSSFWGSDLETLAMQGAARGLPARSPFVFTVGEQMLPRQPENMPDGTILGARGANGMLAPDNALSNWFRDAYVNKYNVRPNFPAYQMFQSLLGVKAAWEKAAAAGGTDKPASDALADAFRYLEFETASGTVRMAIGGGHQAVQDVPIGIYSYDKAASEPRVSDVEVFPAMCVNPPDGVSAAEWLEKGMPGAQC